MLFLEFLFLMQHFNRYSLNPLVMNFIAMQDDMDINAGVLAEGRQLDQLRDQMIDLMIRVINGENSKAEANDMDVLTFMTVHPPF
jgi:altronate dehydratase